MQTLCDVTETRHASAFQRWRDIIYEHFAPVELKRLGEVPFHGRIEHAQIGALSVTRMSSGAVAAHADAAVIRRASAPDTITALFTLDGELFGEQSDCRSVARSGDFLILDRSPTRVEVPVGCRALVVDVPRLRLERALGPAKLYAMLAVDGSLGATSLLNSFMAALLEGHEQMDHHTALRLGDIAVDLMVAALSERLAQAPSKPFQSTVTVRRAKAFIEMNLGDPALDPPRIAAAMGVSLRHLQQLFQEHGQHISDWVWQRRLETAAQRLADPSLLHLSLGTVSYGCGFVNQAHFSRRFKERYGVSPGDYQRMAMMRKAGNTG